MDKASEVRIVAAILLPQLRRVGNPLTTDATEALKFASSQIDAIYAAEQRAKEAECGENGHVPHEIGEVIGRCHCRRCGKVLTRSPVRGWLTDDDMGVVPPGKARDGLDKLNKAYEQTRDAAAEQLRKMADENMVEHYSFGSVTIRKTGGDNRWEVTLSKCTIYLPDQEVMHLYRALRQMFTPTGSGPTSPTS